MLFDTSCSSALCNILSHLPKLFFFRSLSVNHLTLYTPSIFSTVSLNRFNKKVSFPISPEAVNF